MMIEILFLEKYNDQKNIITRNDIDFYFHTSRNNHTNYFPKHNTEFLKIN